MVCVHVRHADANVQTTLQRSLSSNQTVKASKQASGGEFAVCCAVLLCCVHEDPVRHSLTHSLTQTGSTQTPSLSPARSRTHSLCVPSSLRSHTHSFIHSFIIHSFSLTTTRSVCWLVRLSAAGVSTIHLSASAPHLPPAHSLTSLRTYYDMQTIEPIA